MEILNISAKFSMLLQTNIEVAPICIPSPQNPHWLFATAQTRQLWCSLFPQSRSLQNSAKSFHRAKKKKRPPNEGGHAFATNVYFCPTCVVHVAALLGDESLHSVEMSRWCWLVCGWENCFHLKLECLRSFRDAKGRWSFVEFCDSQERAPKG